MSSDYYFYIDTTLKPKEVLERLCKEFGISKSVEMQSWFDPCAKHDMDIFAVDDFWTGCNVTCNALRTIMHDRFVERIGFLPTLEVCFVVGGLFFRQEEPFNKLAQGVEALLLHIPGDALFTSEQNSILLRRENALTLNRKGFWDSIFPWIEEIDYTVGRLPDLY